MNQHEQGSYELATHTNAVHTHTYLCCQFSIFTGFLSVQKSGSLNLVPSLGFFAFFFLIQL